MNKSITLENNFELQLVPDSYEKTITVYLFDVSSDTRVTLTTFEGGRWKSISQTHIDKFFELVKNHPKIRVALKKVFGGLREETTSEFITSMKCLRRKITIQIKKHLK
jgi:hypothetical protein